MMTRGSDFEGGRLSRTRSWIEICCAWGLRQVLHFYQHPQLCLHLDVYRSNLTHSLSHLGKDIFHSLTCEFHGWDTRDAA